MPCKQTYTLFLIFICTAHSYAQQGADNSAILNGREYTRYALTVQKGHAYFLTDSLLPGTVRYDGVQCNGVELMLDESLDQLITRDASGVYLVQLVRDKIDSFTIDGNRFLQLRKDTSVDDQPDDGFYRVLYENNLLVLKKEKKKIRENNGYNADFERNFETTVSYYVKIGGKYRQFTGSREFVSLFKGNSKELRKYIHANDLDYKKDPDEFVTRLSAYAETLTPVK